MKSLAQRAYESLETLLVTLQLKPGDLVTEAELMERLELGRTPVREAIQRLAAEGLLEVRPRRGIQVTPLHYGDAMALLETRRELERLVAAKAAQRATPAQREGLRKAASAMARAASRKDLKAYLAADHACDILLEEACRNPYAMQALAPLRTQCRRLWTALQHQGDLPRFAAIHGELMEAVAVGSEGRAAELSGRIVDQLQSMVSSALSLP